MIKTLIVDDDPVFIDLIRSFLDEKTYYLLIANDGEEGLIAALKHKPDIILLDVEMPKMRGWELCKLLKHNHHTERIPILMLTSRSELSDIIVAMQLGADDYLAKPFESSELLSRIERLLTKQQQKEKDTPK